MIDDLKMFCRYFSGLPGFLHHTLSLEESRHRIERQLEMRNCSFLNILRRGICGRPSSPYARLMKHAGVGFEEIAESVGKDGIEKTLERLYECGIYVTFEEFKGRRPVQRRGISFEVRAPDFDNPLLAKQYELRTGGSRGAGTRIIVDFELLTHESAYHYLSLVNLGLEGRPPAIWYSVPPVVNGIKHVLRNAKIGQPVRRWFSQNRVRLRPGSLKYAVFTGYAVYGSRLFGNPLPAPEFTPLEDAGKVARWLAEMKRHGTPAELHTNPSSGVRACLAASERGYDIAGTFFRFNSEPYTPAKEDVVASTGSRAAAQYSLAEMGNIGMACAEPRSTDDVHLLTDKLAVIQREKRVNAAVTVDALYYTTLLPSSPKLMLNVESDDYGRLETRSCGCLFGKLGFQRHLSCIRSYDKLTSEGMTFLGGELIRLVDEELPRRFGGYPTDYQFVEEEEEGGLPKVGIVVSPRVRALDETQMVAFVLERLGNYPDSRKLMAELWKTGNTLRVIRREPFATGAAKILPLHLLRGRERQT
jgi:hypothetical protein